MYEATTCDCAHSAGALASLKVPFTFFFFSHLFLCFQQSAVRANSLPVACTAGTVGSCVLFARNIVHFEIPFIRSRVPINAPKTTGATVGFNLANSCSHACSCAKTTRFWIKNDAGRLWVRNTWRLLDARSTRHSHKSTRTLRSWCGICWKAAVIEVPKKGQ